MKEKADREVQALANLRHFHDAEHIRAQREGRAAAALMHEKLLADVVALLSAHLERLGAAPSSPPVDSDQWIAEAKLTLDRLSAFLQAIGAPHAVDWREWIDNAEKHVAALTPPAPAAAQASAS